MAVVSSRRSRLETEAEEGDSKAKAVLALIERPNVFLSTIQIGITLVGTLAGTFGGAAVVKRLAPLIARLPLPGVAGYAQSLAFASVVVGITYLSLIIGELVPKRIALAQPEAIARIVAPPMRWLASLARPFVWLLASSTDVVLGLLGQRTQEPLPASEEEVRYLMTEGARAGVFAGTERELVERVFRFADQRVGELMQPRSEVLAIDADLPAEQIRKLIQSAGYSRFPVYRDDLDHILGIVHARDVLLQGDQINLKGIVRQPLYVPESQLISTTLHAFQSTHNHMAIVVNEYGGTEGLVTLEDVLEQLVGEIEDEHDRAEQMIVRREDGALLVDGLLPVDELKELLAVEQLPIEDHYQFNTLAGWIIAQLGRLPRVADSVTALGRRFEVVDMDGRRVDRVLIAPLPEPAKPQENKA
jgi:putative hemolysin